MTHEVGFVPRKSVAEVNSVERKLAVTSGTVNVFLEGTGSLAAGFGVAAPDAAADREAGVGALGGGTKMSTVYAGVLESAKRGAVKIAVWSTSSYLPRQRWLRRQRFLDRHLRVTEQVSEAHDCVLSVLD